MRNVFIIHGAEGNPDENWFPWLRAKLEKVGYKVYVPSFPTPKNQSLESWSTVIDSFRNEISNETILIGHSLGVAFIFKLLEKENITAAFLIADFIGKIGNDYYDNLNISFIEKGFSWDKIKQNCSNFRIYHGDDDPYVSIANAEEISKQLKVPITLVENAGHFNQASGYTEFEQLFRDIKSLA